MCVFNNEKNNNNSRAIVLLLSCKFYLFLQQPIFSKVHDDLETKWDPNSFFRIIMFWGVKIEDDFGFLEFWFHTIEFCMKKWWYDMKWSELVGYLFIYLLFKNKF